ncbi:MAG: DUF393 domain-containing protein [Bacteroidales bacterium]
MKTVIYDGKCMLCSRSIAFLVKRDKKKKFEYISYTSNTAKKVLKKYNINFTSEQFIIYVNNDKCYTRSRAVLEIFKDLGGFWSIMFVFVVVPPFIRNSIYSFIAKNRHRWFFNKI